MLKTKVHERLALLADDNDKGDFIITPEQARSKLEILGYEEKVWPRVASEGRGNHYIRALIAAASGDSPANLNDMYHAMYPEKEEQSDADRNAASAADMAVDAGIWEDFTDTHATEPVIFPETHGNVIIRAEHAVEPSEESQSS